MISITKTLGIAALVAFSVSTQAQITFTSGGSLTAWNGTPNYVSLANASLIGFSAQSDLTITGSYGILAETFTPSSTFTLGSISLLMSVNNVNNPYLINLYHLGPAGTVSVSSGAATYTPGTSLFSDNSVTIAATTGGQVQGTFTLPSIDQVTLTAGEQYAFEIWTPSGNGSSGIQLYRNATADPGGQMFSSANEINPRLTLVGAGQSGAAPKTAALALYAVPVPEPATMSLLSLGALALLGVVRRAKK